MKVRERVRRKRHRWLFPIATAVAAAFIVVALMQVQRSMMPVEPPIDLVVAGRDSAAGVTDRRALPRDTQAERLAAESLDTRVRKYGRMMRLVVTDPRLVSRDITVGTTEIGRDRLRMKAARRDRLAVDVIIPRRDWINVPDDQLADLVVAEVLRRVP